MMKKLCLLFAAVIAATAADARLTTLWEDHFSAYQAGDLDAQSSWSAAEGAYIVVENGNASGGREVLLSSDYKLSPMTGIPVQNLRPGYSVQIVVDHRINQSTTANRGYFEVGLTGTDNYWTEGWSTNYGWEANSPTIGTKIEYNNYAEGTVKYFPNKEHQVNSEAILAVAPTYAGFQPNNEGAQDTDSDLLRYTLTITKSATTNEFEISGTFLNLDTGATLSKTAPNVVNANAWNSDVMYVFLKSVDPVAKVSDVHIDRVEVSQGKALKPRIAVLWEDDFSDITGDAMQVISSRPGWQLNNNHSGWAITNGIAVQRPGITADEHGSGWNNRGAIRTDAPFSPAVGETMQMEFDWTPYTDGERNNFRLFSFGVQTNIWTDGVWENRPNVNFNSENAAMGFQFTQMIDGTMVPQFADQQIVTDLAPIPLNFFGVDPVNGADDGDVIHVTYRAMKTITENEWKVNLSLYNTVSGAEYSITEITVENAVTYNHDAFYFTSIFPWATEYGLAGNEFNNFKASQLGMPGYDGWAKRNWPSEDLSDRFGDFDGNGMINLHKYAFGGDPTMANDNGIAQNTRLVVNEDGDQVLEFTYAVVADSESGIDTYMETIENLHGNLGSDYYVAGISEEVDGFVTVTNHIYTTSNTGFAILRVEDVE